MMSTRIGRDKKMVNTRLEAAKKFYGEVLGCAEGRSSSKWQDYSLHGHQIVCHWAGDDYKCQDYFNPVDGDEVPVPHFGLALTVDEWKALAARLKEHGVKFVIEPTLRFEGMPGEQYTMFFKDPSNNNTAGSTGPLVRGPEASGPNLARLVRGPSQIESSLALFGPRSELRARLRCRTAKTAAMRAAGVGVVPERGHDRHLGH